MIIRKKPININLPDEQLTLLLNLSLRHKQTDTSPCFEEAGSTPDDSTLLLDRFLWFDIETTGLSARHCPLYLIGCVRREKEGFVRYQFMTQCPEDEADVLSAFLDLCDDADCLVHFNGDTFDVPYVRERCRFHGLRDIPGSLIGLDLLKMIRPWRRLLGLSGCRQKDLERYLGLFREDKYDGGELIQIYYSYEQLHRDDLYDLLILHNGDDMDGMMELCKLLAVPLFFDGRYTLKEMELARYQNDLPGELILSVQPAERLTLPRLISVLFSGCALRAEENLLTLRLPIYQGTLKYFYPNYRDYYYLPEEDYAIHKSVGEFVDKEHRKKATAATCYTKKTGLFLSQPSVIYTPALYETYKVKTVFFSYEDDCFSDPDKFNDFLHGIIAIAKSGKG